MHERTVVEHLVETVRADALGVAGYAPTRAALAAGQADTLAVSEEAPLAPVARSELVALAAKSNQTCR